MSKILSNFDNLKLSDFLSDIDVDRKTNKLTEIIENDGITSYFQPIVDLFSCNVFGYEMLARGKGCLF